MRTATPTRKIDLHLTAEEEQPVHMPLPQWAIWSEVAIRIGWAVTAGVIGAIMSRRGHDGGLWATVGLVLGPFAVPVAVISARRAARRPPIVVAEGAWNAGEPVTLVVIDADDPRSWPAQAAAADRVAGPAELAVVVGRDTLDLSAREATLEGARSALAAVATAMDGPTPRQVILEGRPEAAVARHCQLHGITTVVVPPTPTGQRVKAAMGLSAARATGPIREGPQGRKIA